MLEQRGHLLPGEGPRQGSSDRGKLQPMRGVVVDGPLIQEKSVKTIGRR